jgi:membrane protein
VAGALAAWRLISARSGSGIESKAESTADGSGRQESGQHQESGHQEDERGRSAATPSDIPAKGWKDILWRVWENISEHRVLAIAAGVTFYALLAIFPGMAALVSLYGLFADPATMGKHLGDLASFIPGGATEIIGEQINRLTSQGSGKLGLTFLFSLAISLWSANAGMKALLDALNIVYGEKEKRGFIRLNLISLGFTLVAIIVLLLAIAAVVVVPLVLSYLEITGAGWLMSRVRWPLLFAAVALVLAGLYRWGPSRAQAQWRWITWGSAFASLCWLATSMLFSWYVQNFGNYNKTYGSLGAVIGFMTWIWLSVIVKLIGAELDAEMEHQTARDTTTGAEGPQGERPLGARGARMADTVGSPRV